ncbi:MAG: aspartyl protease family protein [Phaeodactylibacter sp.]|uniref:aspartyl protease family protein n=1 Tax=Phaeodactylibacter sp. TaxID=1940289 RepID=UPI0032EEA1AE
MKKLLTILLLAVFCSTSALPQNSAFKKIPFRLVNNMVIVEARMNGTTGNFILDTGFPLSVVNPHQVEGLVRVPAPQAQSAFSGVPVSVDQFEWAGMERQDMKAVAMNISHLESTANQEIMGIIGAEVLQQVEVMFDFRNQVVLLYDRKSSWLHEQHRPQFSLPFELEQGLPVLRTKMGGRTYRLGLDIGGRYNLMREHLLETLPREIVGRISRQQLLDFANMPDYFDKAPVSDLTISGRSFDPTTFVFTELKKAISADVDGILGLDFLARYRFAINYHKKTIYFWPHGSEINHRQI